MLKQLAHEKLVERFSPSAQVRNKEISYKIENEEDEEEEKD